MRKTAQASLELAFSLICLLVLFWGSFNIFLWLNKQMINRQEDYASSREQIGDTWSIKTIHPWFFDIDIPIVHQGAESKPVDEFDTSRYPKLDVFKQY